MNELIYRDGSPVGYMASHGIVMFCDLPKEAVAALLPLPRPEPPPYVIDGDPETLDLGPS